MRRNKNSPGWISHKESITLYLSRLTLRKSPLSSHTIHLNFTTVYPLKLVQSSYGLCVCVSIFPKLESTMQVHVFHDTKDLFLLVNKIPVSTHLSHNY